MRTIFVLLLMLFLSLSSTSCTPDKIAGSQTEQEDVFAVDPPSEEAGEEDEIDPND